MVSEITIAKGAYTITVYATTIAENYTNKLYLITPAQSKANQSEGSEDVKIVDLLRITHQFIIKAYITGTDTKTAKEVKADLIAIYDGGGTDGGLVTMAYDGTDYTGKIEKLNITEISADSPSEDIRDYGRYELAITFVEGIEV